MLAELSFMDPIPRTASSDALASFAYGDGGASEHAQRPASEHVSGVPAVSCNTATLTSQLLDMSKWGASGGVDWLEGLLYGKFDDDDATGYGHTEQLLEAARVNAESGQGSRLCNVMGASLVVSPRGQKWGISYFQWVGEYDGIRFSLARRGLSDKCAVAKVQIGSAKLMRDGAQACWAEAMQILRELGVLVDRSVLYRLDACLDLPGVSVSPFCEAISKREVITRVKSSAHLYKRNDGEWSGCSLGNRKGVLLNIYDKAEELRVRGDLESDAKRHILIQRRWGVDCDVATRVEFQIRGDWLRSRWDGVRSVEDALEQLPAIVGHLVQHFFRLVDGEVDRENNHQQRAKVSPLWAAVVDGFGAWLGSIDRELERCKPGVPDRERFFRRLVSSALSVAALSPDYVDGRTRAIQYVVDALAKFLPPQDELMAKLNAKHETWKAKGVFQIYRWDDLPEGDWAKTCYYRESGEAGEAFVRYEVGFDVEDF